jgi:hypothetical protein
VYPGVPPETVRSTEPDDAPWQFTFTTDDDNAGKALIVITTVETAAEHGPAPSASFDVNVRVTVPAVLSAALGVYTALRVFLFGLKLPVPPVHDPVVAAPPTEPLRCTVLPVQICRLTPALAITTGFTVTVTVKVFPVQVPFTGVTM